MDEHRAEDDDRDEGQIMGDGDAPTGGTEITEEQLQADNAVEEDTLKTVEPDNPTA